MSLKVTVLDFGMNTSPGSVRLSIPMAMPFGQPFVFPIESAPIQSLVAELDIDNLPPIFFLSVDTANGVRFRSLELSRADAVPNEDGDDTLSFTLLEPEGSPVFFGPAELAGMGPNLPLTNGDVTINTMNVTPMNGFLRAGGTATYDPLGLNVTYTADVTLDPRQGLPIGSRLIDVDVISSSVRSSSGGLFGWLVNFFVDAILSFMQDDFRVQMERSIQDAIDDAISDMMGDEVPARATVTIEEISVSNAGLSVFAVVGIPSSDLCPGNLASGSIRMRPKQERVELRAIRDRLLKDSYHGKGYLQALNDHKAEIIRILAAHPAALKSMDRLFDTVRAEFAESKKAVLSKETVVVAKKFLSLIAGRAGARLSAVCGALVDDLESLKGKDIGPLLAAKPLTRPLKKTTKQPSAKKRK